MTSHVAIFAFDLNEASQAKTIQAIRATGARVTSLSFRRRNMPPTRPDWRDLPLGESCNGLGPRRLLALLRAVPRVLRHARALADADVVVARNLDLALLALLGRAVAGSRAPMIYQCLDIHGAMTGPGLRGAILRLAERFVLRRCARVVVSAPAFADAHFRAVQRHRGDIHLLENRIWWPAAPPPRPRATAPRQGPLRLGWVGTLRCPDSLALLAALAERMGPSVLVLLRGTVHAHQLPHLDRVLARHPNMRYEGRYTYPDGLARAYAGLECVWAQDLWQRGGNSDWLLPNRLYEAGWFGCPCIAVDGTATADRVARAGTGITIPAPRADLLEQALNRLGPEGLATLRARLLAQPASRFCLDPRTSAP